MPIIADNTRLPTFWKPKSKIKNITGQRVGRLLVLGLAGRYQHATQWYCLCRCGTAFWTNTNRLQQGTVTSCGCARTERLNNYNRTHGMAGTPAYRVWLNMIDRCCRPNSTAYQHYGGRGIQVCVRWQRFENFYADMGGPHGLTLERIDNNGNYEPSNCKWATRREQALNRRYELIAFDGKSMHVAAWARHLNLNVSTLRQRLLRMPLEKALTAPLQAHRFSR